MWTVRVEKDSINQTGNRLTTFVLTYPRFIHAEFLTHRMVSKNSASSRAIPVSRMIEQVENDPAMPIYWGKNQPGMQAKVELVGEELERAKSLWLSARTNAVAYATAMNQAGAHKQIVNRILEPFSWITVVASATEWVNFWNLRLHPDAQPEFQHLAKMMRAAYDASQPQLLRSGMWHLPFWDWSDSGAPAVQWGYGPALTRARQVATGRIARVSYLTHDGRRDQAKDIELHDQLQASGHWSPFEHCAMALGKPRRVNNFYGFDQYRRHIDPQRMPENHER